MPQPVRSLTINALTVALTAAATLAIRAPVPATQGYINLGDAVIFTAAALFGARAGLLAGGLGSALADLLGGYAHWVPFTLVIKGLEGLLVGYLCSRLSLRGVWSLAAAGVSFAAGGACMVAGYFLAETALYGWQPALAALPGNGIQAAGSLLVGLPCVAALARAGLRPDRQGPRRPMPHA
jgi:uncharacterized membrane protein